MLTYAICYSLGETVAGLVLKGALHPDMQLNNFGIREDAGQVVSLDFADVKKINIPDDLDDSNVRQLTRSLFPIFKDLESFSNISHFRAGFVSRCGHLGREIFSNACNNGFSSFSFIFSEKSALKASFNECSMELSYVPKLNHSLIREWVKFNVDSVKFSNYQTLDQYQRSSERRSISLSNMYYLDYMYFVRSHIALMTLKDRLRIKDNMPNCILILNMAISALSFNLPIMAYGLCLKCSSLNPSMIEIEQQCEKTIDMAKKSGRIYDKLTNFIKLYLLCDLFELLWILDDLERIIPQNELERIM